MVKKTLESKYQKKLIDQLSAMFPGCIILKNDPTYLQGVPDLLIIWHDQWAMLEVKRSIKEPYQPNQEHYIRLLNLMSFCSMICPENHEEVLYALQRTLRTNRDARVSLGEQAPLG